MKTFRLLFILSVFTILSQVCTAQNAITKTQWQEDLLFLQTTVHKEYPHLFKKITKEDWDREVETFYNEIPTMRTEAIRVGMTRMVSLFEYGHTQIYYSVVASDGVLPVNLYHFEDGIFVEGVTNTYAKALGAKVVGIEGTPIAEVLSAIRPVVPAENDMYFKGYGLRFVTVPSVLYAQGILKQYSDRVILQLEKDGVQFDMTFTTVPLDTLSKSYGFTKTNDQWRSIREQEEPPLYMQGLEDQLYGYTYLPEHKTMYVRQSSVFNDPKEPLEAFYKRLFNDIDSLKVERLVYDVRLNGGGNNYNNKALIKAIMARPKINSTGNFFFLIGRRTFSAAQNLTNEIQNYTEAIIIGEPTGENLNFWGDAKPIALPNSKIKAALSYAWWQDMPQWENGKYTIPHLAVALNAEQYRTNQDPLLDLALSYTDSKVILDPIAHMTELFSAGKMDQLEKDAQRIVEDPTYSFYDFEDFFGKTGYRLFQAGDTASGLNILNFVTKMYPKSQAAWHSLAYAQRQSGNINEAKQSYENLIAINQTSTLAQKAMKSLQLLPKE